MKKRIYCGIIVAILLISLSTVLYINTQYVFIERINYNEEIGIIDTYLNKSYEHLNYYSEFVSGDAEETHGDQLLNFVRDIGYKGKIHYYAAVTTDGDVETHKIIDGLEWMLKSGIRHVNISLSSKIYSAELDSWIQAHPEISIYCSYNNLYNSVADFPAMYDNVIASGSDSRINYREQDHYYKSNQILVCGEKITKYVGNSYLSIYTLLYQN